ALRRRIPADAVRGLVVGLDAALPVLPHPGGGGARVDLVSAGAPPPRVVGGVMIPWRPLAVGLALPVLFTGFVLLDVQRNRSGARAPIDLTEREVTLSAGTDENSGMTAWEIGR